MRVFPLIDLALYVIYHRSSHNNFINYFAAASTHDCGIIADEDIAGVRGMQMHLFETFDCIIYA